jgi:outer membrane biosynthesis protein TonB
MFKFLKNKPLWVKIIFWLFTYPITLPILFWSYSENKKWRKVGRTGFVIVAIPVYLILFAIYSGGGKSSTTQISSKPTENMVVEVKKEETKPTVKSPEEIQKEKDDQIAKDKAENDKKAKEEDDKKSEEQRIANRSSKEKIADLAKEVFKDSKNYVSSGENTATLDVNMDEKSAYDTKHYFEYLLSDFVKFGEQAVKIEGVQDLEVKYNGSIIDKYGKEEQGVVYSILMSKDNFTKYNFKNLEGGDGRMYRAIKDNAGIFMLPTSRAKIDFTQVKFYYPK